MTAPTIILEQVNRTTTGNYTLYTVPAGRRARLTLGVCPISGSNSINVWLVPSGGSAGATTKAIHNYTVSANKDPEVLQGPFLLNEGSSVIVELASGTNCTFHLNGYEDDIPRN